MLIILSKPILTVIVGIFTSRKKAFNYAKVAQKDFYDHEIRRHNLDDEEY
ncbi:MAG: hypothetical protein U9Q72_00430 [Patescibacteria group bacterium]|nr:hypothetical protein [Patescibacteria group bacterium]